MLYFTSFLKFKVKTARRIFDFALTIFLVVLASRGVQSQCLAPEITNGESDEVVYSVTVNSQSSGTFQFNPSGVSEIDILVVCDDG